MACSAYMEHGAGAEAGEAREQDPMEKSLIGTRQGDGALASPFRKCKESLSKIGQNSK